MGDGWRLFFKTREVCALQHSVHSMRLRLTERVLWA